VKAALIEKNQVESTCYGATGLYKYVGGTGASFCIISNMLHIRYPFFKIKKYLQII